MGISVPIFKNAFENTFRTDPESEYQKYFKSNKWMIIKEDLGITLFKKKID
jgi:hypothetical protein